MAMVSFGELTLMLKKPFIAVAAPFLLLTFHTLAKASGFFVDSSKRYPSNLWSDWAFKPAKIPIADIKKMPIKIYRIDEKSVFNTGKFNFGAIILTGIFKFKKLMLL
jgi:hypothetical protein